MQLEFLVAVESLAYEARLADPRFTDHLDEAAASVQRRRRRAASSRLSSSALADEADVADVVVGLLAVVPLRFAEHRGADRLRLALDGERFEFDDVELGRARSSTASPTTI